jgi:hypothetical protein
MKVVDKDHIAWRGSDKQSRESVARWIKGIPHPFLEQHEDCGSSLPTSQRDIWMINGLVSPPGGSDAEKAWTTTNMASPC